MLIRFIIIFVTIFSPNVWAKSNLTSTAKLVAPQQTIPISALKTIRQALFMLRIFSSTGEINNIISKLKANNVDLDAPLNLNQQGEKIFLDKKEVQLSKKTLLYQGKIFKHETKPVDLLFNDFIITLTSDSQYYSLVPMMLGINLAHAETVTGKVARYAFASALAIGLIATVVFMFRSMGAMTVGAGVAATSSGQATLYGSVALALIIGKFCDYSSCVSEADMKLKDIKQFRCENSEGGNWVVELKDGTIVRPRSVENKTLTVVRPNVKGSMQEGQPEDMHLFLQHLDLICDSKKTPQVEIEDTEKKITLALQLLYKEKKGTSVPVSGAPVDKGAN